MIEYAEVSGYRFGVNYSEPENREDIEDASGNHDNWIFPEGVEADYWYCEGFAVLEAAEAEFCRRWPVIKADLQDIADEEDQYDPFVDSGIRRELEDGILPYTETERRSA